MHADGTRKVTTQKTPLLVLGSSDSNRKFHFIGITVATNEDSDAYELTFRSLMDGVKHFTGNTMKPDYLMCDGDSAIHNGFRRVFGDEPTILMCYFHVLSNVQRKYSFNEKANRKTMMDDIRTLHLSPNEEWFDLGCKLFAEKWQEKEPEIVQRLQRSFFSTHKLWFIGAGAQVPKDNNFVESYNSSMKTYQTKHQTQTMKEFIVTALTIVEQKSREYIIDKNPFAYELIIPDETIRIGCSTKIQFLDSGKRVNGLCEFYVFSTKMGNRVIKQKDVDKFYDFNLYKSFAEMETNMFNVYKVTFQKRADDWTKSFCTCPSFDKNYICKHVIAIAHQLGLVEPAPKNYDDEPIFESTRGRPK